VLAVKPNNGENVHTFSVLKFLLDQGIVDISLDLQVFEVPSHAAQPSLLRDLAPSDIRRVCGYQIRNSESFLRNQFEFLFLSCIKIFRASWKHWYGSCSNGILSEVLRAARRRLDPIGITPLFTSFLSSCRDEAVNGFGIALTGLLQQ
jgi:hypothetical protein